MDALSLEGHVVVEDTAYNWGIATCLRSRRRIGKARSTRGATYHFERHMTWVTACHARSTGAYERPCTATTRAPDLTQARPSRRRRNRHHHTTRGCGEAPVSLTHLVLLPDRRLTPPTPSAGFGWRTSNPTALGRARRPEQR